MMATPLVSLDNLRHFHCHIWSELLMSVLSGRSISQVIVRFPLLISFPLGPEFAANSAAPLRHTHHLNIPLEIAPANILNQNPIKCLSACTTLKAGNCTLQSFSRISSKTPTPAPFQQHRSWELELGLNQLKTHLVVG